MINTSQQGTLYNSVIVRYNSVMQFFFKEERENEDLASSPVFPNPTNNIDQQPSITTNGVLFDEFTTNGVLFDEFEDRIGILPSISIESPTVEDASDDLSNTTRPSTGNEKVNNDAATNNWQQGIQLVIKQIGNILKVIAC